MVIELTTERPPVTLTGTEQARSRPRSQTLLNRLRHGSTGHGPWSDGLIRVPRLGATMSESLAFVRRSVAYLAAQGIHQYVVAAAGTPAHRVLRGAVWQMDPSACVAAVHCDTSVSAAQQPPLRGAPDRTRGPRPQDLRSSGPLEPADLQVAMDRHGMDPTRPVALLAIGLLQHVPDDDVAAELLAHLVEPLVPGSFLVLTHLTADYPSPGLRAVVRTYTGAGLSVQPRSRAEVERLLTGLQPVEPGVTLISTWRQDPATVSAAPAEQVASWGAVARVP